MPSIFASGNGSLRVARGAAVLVTALAVAACGKIGSPPERADTPADFEAWDHSLIEAWCDKGERCASVLGPRFSSSAACTESKSFAGDYDRYFGGDRYGDQAAVYRLADPSVREACLAAIAKSPCEVNVSPKECDAARVIAHPLGKGEPCGGVSVSGGHLGPVGVDECGPGLVCDSGPCPTCVTAPAPPPTAAENEACSVELACDGDLACSDTDGPTRLCTASPPLPKNGESCSSGCSGNFRCTGRCAPFPGPGEDCDAVDPYSCMSDLHCDDVGSGRGVCRPYARLGEPCDRFASERPEAGSKACLHGLWCVYDAPDAPTGICSGAPVLTGPSPCSGFGDVGDEMFCPLGGRPVTHDASFSGRPTAYCLCEPLGSSGAKCASAADCGIGLSCLSGRCGAPLPDAEPCTGSDQCESTYCDLSRGRCGSNTCPDRCPGIDRNTDPVSCGGCGNVCTGITVIGPIPGYVRAVDSSGVYAVDPDKVTYLPLTGGDPVTLATGQFDPSAIALDQDHVYITSYHVGVSRTQTGNVVSVPKSGGAPTVLVSGQGSPSALLVAPAGIYWLNGDENAVRLHLFPIGTGNPAFDAATFPGSIVALTVDAANVYAVVNDSPGSTASSSLYSMTRPLGPPVKLASLLPPVHSLAVDSRNVYWATDTTIEAVPLAGGTPVTLAANLSGPGSLVLGARTLYFTDNGGVWSVPTDGGTPRSLIDPPSGSSASLVAVDASSLYWTNADKILSGPLAGVACRDGVCQ